MPTENRITLTPDTPVRYLKGVGPKTAERFEKLGIVTLAVLVFVVLGGLGNIWGSLVAAAALTILPEALREFADYRMLVYAIVLILVMLATHNPTLQSFFARLKPGKKEEKEAA